MGAHVGRRGCAKCGRGCWPLELGEQCADGPQLVDARAGHLKRRPSKQRGRGRQPGLLQGMPHIPTNHFTSLVEAGPAAVAR